MKNKRPNKSRWLGLAVLALPCLVYAMDLTVLNLALPQISADLKPSATQLLWIVDIYGFLVAGSLMTMGTLGDRIGRRKLLLIGAVAFAAASIIAAFSNSASMLIATRALLGLAGATIAPSTLSLIRNMFEDESERTFAVGIWVTSYSAGGAIGPLLGGVLLDYFRWNSVFFIGVPVMVLLLMVGPFLLPEYKDPKAKALDLSSAALSLLTVLPLIYGMKHAVQHGFGVASAIALAAGVLFGVLFVRRQMTLDDPMIDLRLFKERRFTVAILLYTVTTLIIFGIFFFTGQYLQLVAELSPLQAGIWMLPLFVSFMVGSMFAPRLVRYVPPGHLMAVGLLIAVIGFMLISQVESAADLHRLVVGMLIYSLGLAPVFTLTTDLVIGSAPPERTGAASAISETSGELGGALGIAILGTLGTAIYREGLQEASLQTLSHRELLSLAATLGDAVTAASALPSVQAAEVLSVARHSFMRAIESIGLLSAAVSAISAVVVFIAFRKERAS